MIEVQRATHSMLPEESMLERWVSEAMGDAEGDVVLRFVDEEESQYLNRTFRGKDRPTNVLSFAFESPPGIDLPYLGDLVICAPVVECEARQQNKLLEAHYAHMVVHGVLHLLGYDHQDEAQAEIMEALEIELLGRLNYANPYE